MLAVDGGGIRGIVPATHLLDLLATGQSAMSEASLEQLVRVAARDGSRYQRLQPHLPHHLGRMDDTSPENVAGLQRVTREYCAEQAAVLDSIAADL
jgi:hypothetical protein